MAIISYKNKFIYLLNPRTASTATARALCDVAEGEFVPASDILNDDKKIVVPRKHTTLQQLRKHNLVAADDLDSFFKFATVRNPFDSVVSAWAKKVKDYAHLLDDPDSWVNRKPGYAEGLRQAAGLSFPDWVRQSYTERVEKGEAASISRAFIKGVDHTLRYENIDADLAAIADQIGLPEGFELPRVNITKGRDEHDYRSYYDDEAISIISTVFREELDSLGYAF